MPVLTPSPDRSNIPTDHRPDEIRPHEVIVCHPEALAGWAVAGALASGGRGRHDADWPAVVFGDRAVLARSAHGFRVAVVSQLLGPDLRELLDALWFRRSPMGVLVLARRIDAAAIAELMEWGAIGAIGETTTTPRLCAAVAAAAEHRVVHPDGSGPQVSAALDHRAAQRAAAREVLRRLNRRERAMLGALAEGATTAELARHFCLSAHTIRACTRGIGQKIGTSGQLRIAATARHLMAAAAEPSPSFRRSEALIRQAGRSAAELAG